MAAPGIKISELAELSASLAELSNDNSRQKLFLAYDGRNYETPLSALSAKFITRDFAAYETANLSGDWNFRSSKLSASNPQFPLDVANANTLSDLQNIFDRFPSIWRNVRTPFVNKYEPNIYLIGGETTLWIYREDRNAPKKERIDAPGGKPVIVRDTTIGGFPQKGVNLIGPNGGYVFLKSVNPGMREDVYMNVGDDMLEPGPDGQTILDKLGWTDDLTELILTRYEIKPSSIVGVFFHCYYHALDSDESYAAKRDFNYRANITATYAGKTMTGAIRYFGGPHIHTPDDSPHRDNQHWGEGDPQWPDLTGGIWRTYSTDYLRVISATGNVPGWHGVIMDVFNYGVSVYVQKIRIASA